MAPPQKHCFFLEIACRSETRTGRYSHALTGLYLPVPLPRTVRHTLPTATVADRIA
jgi:hypothetical protein